MNDGQRSDPLRQAREFWTVVKLHKWQLLFATVLLETIAIVAIFSVPSQYQASTTVFFDPQKLPERYVTETVSADPSQRLNTLTQEVLTSRRLFDIGRQLKLFKQDESAPSNFIVQMRKSITVQMLKFVSPHEVSSFVIQYTGKDPGKSAAVANALAQSFVDWDLSNRAQQTESTKEFMETQLQDAQQILEGEQAKVQQFKERYSGELPGQLAANLQALSNLHVAFKSNSEALNRLEQEKTLLTAIPEAGRGGIVSDRDRLEAERQSLQAELARERSQLTDQHPDVIATKSRLDKVSQELSQNGNASSGVSAASVRLQIIDREARRLQEEQAKVNERIDKYQAQIDAEPLIEQQYDFLNRNYNKVREQYEDIQDKRLQADMANRLERQQKASHFTIDPSQVPVDPVKPNRPMLLGILLPLCAVIPAGFAIALSQMRRTVNSEESLMLLLPERVRVIGSIPLIETHSVIRRNRRTAAFSVLGCLVCCVVIAAYFTRQAEQTAARKNTRAPAGVILPTSLN